MPSLPRHASPLGALGALALAALIGACNAGPGASPLPTTGPSAPPTTAPTPAGPTPTPSPSPSPTFRTDQIEHPTGATDIVLRMETGGGFVPMGFFATQAPTFTLYGDGTVIFQQIDNRQGGFGTQAYLPWLVGHLDEEGVQSLLQYALADGRLANARDNYDDPMIADAGSTIFNLNAAGQEKVVMVYALFEQPQAGADATDRAGFWKLSQALSNFQTQEGLGEVTEYDAAKYRVTLLQGFGEPVGEVNDWPWDDVTLDDFPAGDEGPAPKILDKEHIAKLLDVPNGGHPGAWVHSPDGESNISLGVRPLLPDEIAVSDS